MSTSLIVNLIVGAALWGIYAMGRWWRRSSSIGVPGMTTSNEWEDKQ